MSSDCVQHDQDGVGNLSSDSVQHDQDGVGITCPICIERFVARGLVLHAT